MSDAITEATLNSDADRDEDDAEDDAEELSEDEAMPRSRASRASTSARSNKGKQPVHPPSPSPTPSLAEADNDDEANDSDATEQQQTEEDEALQEDSVKPRNSRKKVSIVEPAPMPTPEPEEIEDTLEEQEQAEEEDLETPQPKKPSSAKAKIKGKRRAVVASSDEEDAVASSQVQEVETPAVADDLAPPSTAQPQSFSSIVGPNGSGKSNTIDALLFVFGFRATKMRQGKFSELIHNSGPLTAAEEEEFPEADNLGQVEGGEWDEGAEGSEEDYGKKKGKGKGKATGKKGGKKGRSAQDEAYAQGGCDFATVEVWFREVIDLVRPPSVLALSPSFPLWRPTKPPSSSQPGSKDAFSVVADSQLIVARTVRRDNSTRYTVNGKTATPGEVKQMLLGRGIDLTHNRFLILQGEVESIAQMKPKGTTDQDEGLLEYLEDIIGTAKYKPRIEEALVDVERLGDERASQMSRVKLVEKEKSALEVRFSLALSFLSSLPSPCLRALTRREGKQSRKKDADAYLRDQLELVSLQNRLYQRNAHQAQANKDVVEQQLSVAKQELDQEMERQSADRLKYNEDVAYFEAQKAELKQVEDEVNRIVKDLAKLDKTDVQLQEQKKAAVAKLKKLTKSLADDKHSRSEAETSIANNSETLERFAGEKDKLKEELEEQQAGLTKVMDSLRDKIEGFSTQIETEQQALAPWTEQIEEKQNEIKIAQQQLDDLRGKSQSVAADIERAEEETKELREARKTKLAELKDLQKQHKEIASKIEATRERLQAEKANEAKHRAKVADARSKTAEAKASQSASRSKGDVLSAVLKLKEQGRLPGFHRKFTLSRLQGRLGDLGRIDDKYDVAISTAAGAGLDSLVVDTRETAEAIFDHLRKHNIGRASCIALDRFGKVDLSPIATPGETRRLFDLVTPKDAIYTPVFRHVLKNTLVAKTWDEAHAVSTGKVDGQRWRVVTVDGNIAEASGAAQVGGSRPVRGKMSSKIAADDFSPEQVARLEQEEEVAQGKLKAFMDDHRKVEEELKALEKRLAAIEGEVPKVEMDLEANEKDAAEKAELLAELRSHSKPDAGDVKRIAQLEKAIDGFNQELEKVREKASGYEQRINKLQAQIEEVGGLKLRSQKAKVSDLQDQIRHNEERLVKAKTGKAKAEKDLAKFVKAIEANEAKAEEAQAEIAELEEHIEVNSAEAEPIRQTVDKIQDAFADKRDELALLKRELDDQEQAIIDAFNEQEKQLKEIVRVCEHWTGKLGELEMPEFDQLDNDDEEEGEEGVGKMPQVDDVLRVLEPEEIAELDSKKLKADIAFLEERLEKNNADLAVLQEYRRREEEFRKRGEEFEAVSREWDAAKNQVTDLRNQRLVQFMKGFGVISNKLKEMYQMITLGGNAELELYDSADPFSEGILFSVMPPKKSWKNISNLSGGEKTLSSLALVFALHVYKPTPLYFMDEIDAALDFRNVSIVANYIKDRTKNAQFIIISLRNNMFELSSRLIGIYKVANQTRSVAIDNKELSELKGEEEEEQQAITT
ncbi:SPOSA6832_03944, partial [Sporobolomyces salmonicolor]